MTQRRLSRYRAIVTDAPVSYSVYSAFSFYGERRGRELPGTWLARAMVSLGHELAAVRQTLYRMEASRELESRVAGRVKFYRLSAAARAEAEAGLAKIRAPVDEETWDGRWTIVHLLPGFTERVERERLRSVLEAEGFANVGTGMYLHPRNRTERLLAAAGSLEASEMVLVFRGERVGDEWIGEALARWWPLKELARRYERFLTHYARWQSRVARLAPRDAFVLRFALVFEYLEIAWRDPDIVPSLLPADWPGFRARVLAGELYDRLLPAAIAYGDELLALAVPRKAATRETARER